MCDGFEKTERELYMGRGDATLKEDLPKSVNETLRTLRDLEYEVELRRALSKLSQDFERSKAGRISSVDLADRIRESQNGPNRESCLLYTGGLDLRFLASRAVQKGVIQKGSIPKEVLPCLQKAPSFSRPLL
jgi:hypothetical protein